MPFTLGFILCGVGAWCLPMLARKRWHVLLVIASVLLVLYGITAVWGMTEHDRYEGLPLMFQMAIALFGVVTGGLTQVVVLASDSKRLQRRVLGGGLSLLLVALIAVQI